MHESAAFLLAVMLRRGAADKETAVQVHRDDGKPVISAHPMEDAVAQNTSVVHHRVDAAEMIQRGLDDLLRGSPFRDGVSADLSQAAILANDRPGLLGRR